MHYLCSTFGSSGDVFPLVGLGVELRRRGHQVTLATNGHFESLARRHGLDFEPLGDEAQYQACIGHPDLWEPRRAFAHIFNTLKPALRRQYELHAEAARRGPVVGIANVFGFGARVAEDHLKIPVITVHLQPSVIWSDIAPPRMPVIVGPRWLKKLLFRVGERFFIDPVVCPTINAWRGELGLPPIKNVARTWHSRAGIVGMFPEWFCAPQADWPAPHTLTGFPLWSDGSASALAPEVQDFLDAGSPPVVFTPGTANAQARKFFEAATTACRSLDRRAILLTPFDEQVPRDRPAEVAHFCYVPLDLLLPHVAALVHHGGIGTTAQALAAGIPQVIMPLAHDQFDNADRVVKLNVGRWIAVRRFSQQLPRVLGDVLCSDTMRVNSQQAAYRLRARDGLAQAADAVERMTRSSSAGGLATPRE